MKHTFLAVETRQHTFWLLPRRQENGNHPELPIATDALLDSCAHFFRLPRTKTLLSDKDGATLCIAHWFWVDDRDLDSKRSLGFLMLLFTLIESDSSAPPPLLTIGRH